MKLSKKIIVTTFVLLLNVIVLGCCCYLFVVRDDIVFGLKDAFSERTCENNLEITGIDIENIKNISIKDIKDGRTDIKYNNFLLLINQDHLIGNEFSPKLQNYKNTSHLVDENIISPLSEMLKQALNDTEDKILIMSSYRDFKHQAEIFNEDKKIAAIPGSSEHQSGLALDLYVKQNAGRKFISTRGGKWIYNNCYNYGFVIRYPLFKENITSIPYEPWHIRYVGLPHSKIMYQNKYTLEEYINKFSIDMFYKYDNYIISRQKAKNNEIIIPSNLKNVQISPDNMGFYFITGEIIS